jgi:hypothetical protein
MLTATQLPFLLSDLGTCFVGKEVACFFALCVSVGDAENNYLATTFVKQAGFVCLMDRKYLQRSNPVNLLNHKRIESCTTL